MQSRTLIVAVPRTKSTGHGTSITQPNGSATSGSELDDELGEEDINHLLLVKQLTDFFLDCRLQGLFAFGRDEGGGCLLRQELQNRGTHEHRDDRRLLNVLRLFGRAEDELNARFQ